MKLKIMPEFSSTGIWDMKDEGVMVEFDSLGLPDNLIKDFEAWIRYYDRCFEGEYDHMKKGGKYLNQKGRHLARRVKALFPYSTIIYHGENEKGLLDPIEILLKM